MSLLAACFYSELTAMVYAGLSLANFFHANWEINRALYGVKICALNVHMYDQIVEKIGNL